MRLILIRHGQTIDNVRGALGAVVPGPPLTDLGLEQAAALPGALADERIDAIYTSTMVRTQLTARPLARARGLEPVIVDGLREIGAGELEQRSDVTAIRQYAETVLAWGHDRDARIPGGEDGNEFFERYDDAVARIAREHAGGAVAVVSHGAAIRAWVSSATPNIDGDFSLRNHLGNTGVVIVDGSPSDGWYTVSWQGEPVGGAELRDVGAPDPAGQAV
jgi:probable phosphoglycerate mutase